MKICRICGSESNLIHHHNEYFPKERTILLCKRCHRVIHSGLSAAQLIEISIIVREYGGQWHEDFEKFTKGKGYAKAYHKEKVLSELDRVEEVIAEKEIAIDLLNHWEGASL